MKIGSWRIEPVNTAGRGPLISGMALIMTGLLVLLVPEILVAFIAATFMLTGASLLWLGWQLRRRSNHNVRIHLFQKG